MADDSKTEKATPKKRRDERKEGHVAMSKDVVTVVSLLVLFYALRAFFPMIYKEMRQAFRYFIDNVASMDTISIASLREVMVVVIVYLAKCILPLGFLGIMAAVIATGVQTRFLFAKKKLGFKLKNLNPINGIKNLFSVKQLLELLKGILKIIVLCVVMYQVLKADILQIIKMQDMDIGVSAAYILKMILSMVTRIAMVFAAIAGFDFFYQRWSFEKSIKMTKQEVKEEFKQQEGDPKIKGKIRSIQQQRARSRMMQAVPTADVIIRNPTHYAVALKYDIDHDNAPILVAKGQDHVALKIIEIAEQNQVAIIENRPLARGIFASTPLDCEIPAEYYGVVAEILVQVFRMNKKVLE